MKRKLRVLIALALRFSTIKKRNTFRDKYSVMRKGLGGS